MKTRKRKSQVKNSDVKASKVGNTGITKLVNDLTKSFHDSLMTFVQNISNPKLALNKALPVGSFVEPTIKQPKHQIGYEMFIEALRQIGRPAMTREIAARFRMIHPKANLPKSKTQLMQQLYNSASYLSKEGIIERRPVGNRIYEYSLKSDTKADTHKREEVAA